MPKFQRKSPGVTAEQVEIWTEVETAAGLQTVAPGDWIVTDGAGARTVLSSAAFALEYGEASVVAPEESGQVGLTPPVVEDTPTGPVVHGSGPVTLTPEVEAAAVETPPPAAETPAGPGPV